MTRNSILTQFLATEFQAQYRNGIKRVGNRNGKKFTFLTQVIGAPIFNRLQILK